MAKKILTVDDSALMRRVLSDIIASDDRFILEDYAVNGLEAYEKIKKNPTRFDLLISDINMPKMSGIELLEKLNSDGINIPVIIVSSLAVEGASDTIRCLELGAFDFLTKPSSFTETRSDDFKNKIKELICSATNTSLFPEKYKRTPVKVAEEKSSSLDKGDYHEGPMSYILRTKYNRLPHKKVGPGARKLVIICSSTGGPKALQTLITKLPPNLDAPVILVQHMPASFTATLAERLDELSAIHVKESEDGETLEKGTVYLAKGGTHLEVASSCGKLKIRHSDAPARSGLKPCGDVTFESLTQADADEFTCVVLTGMGSDGTRGIGNLSEKKNCYIVAQDEATSTVYAMPRILVESGITDDILPIGKIADAITQNVGLIQN